MSQGKGHVWIHQKKQEEKIKCFFPAVFLLRRRLHKWNEGKTGRGGDQERRSIAGDSDFHSNERTWEEAFWTTNVAAISLKASLSLSSDKEISSLMTMSECLVVAGGRIWNNLLRQEREEKTRGRKWWISSFTFLDVFPSSLSCLEEK